MKNKPLKHIGWSSLSPESRVATLLYKKLDGSKEMDEMLRRAELLIPEHEMHTYKMNTTNAI